MSVYTVCPLCKRCVEKNSEKEASDLADSHNEKRHNGENIATVTEPNLDDIETLMLHASDVLEENKLNQFQNYLMHNHSIMNKYFCWNGKADKQHEEYEDFKELKNIVNSF